MMSPSGADTKLGHLERTATEPRDKSLHTVVLQSIDQVNDQTRVFRLGIPQNSPPIRFLPGQWLDVYIPGVEKAGGFTITSTPRGARLPHPPVASSSSPGVAGGVGVPTIAHDESASRERETNNKKGEGEQGQGEGPYLELAVQRFLDNPPAAWLWRDPPTSILGEELRVRVGGSFVWPPPGINVRALRRAIFVAGGVGVNPLVSMLSSIAMSSPTQTQAQAQAQPEIHFFYSLKDPRMSGKNRLSKNMLFLDRIAAIFREKRVKGQLHVFLTGGATTTLPSSTDQERKHDEKEKDKEDRPAIICEGVDDISFHPRRCTVRDDVAAVLGTSVERRLAVVYVCGVPSMTDEFVAKLTDRQTGLGMEPHRVLCEKWW